MIVVMKKGASEAQIGKIEEKVKKYGLKPHISRGVERTIIGLIGDERVLQPEQLTVLDGVEKVMPVLKPYKLASREFHPQSTVIDVSGVKIGGKTPVIMAGPCAVESKEQIVETAIAVKKAGASILRGGAFKPRTSPYSFQGLEEKGLEYLAEAREKTGLPIVTEVMEATDLKLVASYADILQVGARNMQNFKLLKAVGRLDKPVLLKRGMSANLKELLMSAEYIMSEGNHKVILCERGIRTFSDFSRNTLDLNLVPKVKDVSHLPVIVDPSHGTGNAGMVKPMSLAALAAGAHGLLVEVHPNPEEAVSDGDQSITLSQFSELMRDVKKILNAIIT